MIDLSAQIRLSTQPRSIDIGADKAMTVANAASKKGRHRTRFILYTY